MKTRRYILTISVLLVIGAILFAPYGVYKHFNNKGAMVKVEIPQGISAIKIADILKKEGVIQSPLFFRLCVKISGSGPFLRSGVFDLNKNMSSIEVIWHLINDSGTPTFRVTILEGWRIEEIAAELFKRGIIDNEQKFISIAKEEKSEGFLFPSTYQLPKNMAPIDIIKIMRAEYNRNISPVIAMAKNELNENEVLTLASIVEREAVFDDERPKIAAVYLNRLKIGKRLEADPTVQYALGYFPVEGRHWKKGLTYTDLKVDSPYNTYRNIGLPPSPIASPGLSSVKAVLNPEANFDALYFVADNTGRHIFSKTYHQHLQTIKTIRNE